MAAPRQAPQHRALELHPKVAATSVGTLVGTIFVWLLSLTGVNPPPPVTVAITGLIGATLAYFAPWMAGEPAADTGEVAAVEPPVTSMDRGPAAVLEPERYATNGDRTRALAGDR
jgi:xanthosine utilization system XapX-like protein